MAMDDSENFYMARENHETLATKIRVGMDTIVSIGSGAFALAETADFVTQNGGFEPGKFAVSSVIAAATFIDAFRNSIK